MRNFIRVFLLSTLPLLSLTNLEAQTVVFNGKQANELIKGTKEVRLKGEAQFLSFWAYKTDNQPDFKGFLSDFNKDFGLDDKFTFQLIDRQEDVLGQNHYRYQQFFNGVPIRTAHLSLHVKEGKVLSVSGFFYTQPFEHTEFEISEAAALSKALEAIPADNYKWEVPIEESVLNKEQNNNQTSYYPKGEPYYIGKNLASTSNKQRLCYRFDIYAHQPVAREHIYIDASNGAIIFSESIIKHISDSTTASTAYSGTRTIVVDSVSPKNFRLRDALRGNGVETYNMNNGTTYGNATDFVDSTNSWVTFSPAIDQHATDAHWGAEKTYDYFYNEHNRNSINNQGFALKSYIHYKNGYNNAFWDGQRMTYGDGTNNTNPLTTVDICGHEITHGLTRFTSNLIYAKESGALNESFSDIFGFSVEKYARPNNWNWLLGEDIGAAFRSLSNPNQLNDPDTYDGANWVDQKNCVPNKSNDKCGVHTNSGVQNYWFYLLSAGGTGVNDRGDSINVMGVGTDTAAAIAFRTNVIYLTPSSDYEDARFFSFKSAVDLYGACSPAVKSTINAWHAVGVGDKYKPGFSAEAFALNDTVFCTIPANVNFDTEGHNIYDFKWYFGDGDSSLLSAPTHQYLNSGTYDVTLIADGLACGIDTIVKQNYIHVDTALKCNFTLDGGAQTKTQCSGSFYDFGGLNGTYPNNHSDTLYIQPLGDQILFEFTKFDIEGKEVGFCSRDYVEIFDGPTTASPSLGRFCNSVLPPDSILSSGSALTIVFYADRYEGKRGFGAKWKCLQSTIAPQADFSVSNDTACDGRIKFFNKSVNGAKSFDWDFGDGNTSNKQNPIHNYENNGSYDVTLSVQNTYGIDSITKNAVVYINRPQPPIVKDDTFCLKEKVALGLNTNTNNRWYLTEDAEAYFFLGDTLRLNKIDTVKNYFVENFVQQKSHNIIPLSVNGNTYISDSTAAVYFDVKAPMILESVVLYTDESRYRTILVKNAEGAVVQSKSVWSRSPAIQVALDFELYPDSNYSITVADRDPSLRINSDGATFPYSVSGLIDIKGSNLGGTALPFFYYWTVRPLNCVSKRAKITAYLDTNCVITNVKDFEKQLEEPSIYPNPFSGNFSIQMPQKEPYTFYLFNVNGQLILKEKSKGGDGKHLIKTNGLAEGVYFLKIQGKENTYQKKLIKY